MIDGHFKSHINRFWDYCAKTLAWTGITPNQVTWLGLILVLISCLFYLVHNNELWFGISLSVIFTLDALDGALARITDSATKYGGYLDAVADRYQELAVYLTIAFVNDYWAVCFLAMTGSLLVSYNKARTAIEKSVNNDNWPDLLERMERLILLCGGLLLDQSLNVAIHLPQEFLYYIIVLIGILAHLTALQRFLRARRWLLN